MKVGTLVKVCEDKVRTDDRRRFGVTRDEMLGYIIETCSRDEAIRIIRKWEMREAIYPVFKNLGLLMTNKWYIHSDDGLDQQLRNWVGTMTYAIGREPKSQIFHKIMLQNGNMGWATEYWLEEV